MYGLFFVHLFLKIKNVTRKKNQEKQNLKIKEVLHYNCFQMFQHDNTVKYRPRQLIYLF